MLKKEHLCDNSAFPSVSVAYDYKRKQWIAKIGRHGSVDITHCPICNEELSKIKAKERG